MKLHVLILAAVAAIWLPAAAAAPAVTAADVPETEVTSAPALQRLVGNTGVTLQWNWETGPGELTAEARDGRLALWGEQRAANGGRLELDGVVTRLDERIFLFKGRIVIHDAEANVNCVRNGDFTFRITGARKFWRLKEQIAGCPGRADLTDYVDIHFN